MKKLLFTALFIPLLATANDEKVDDRVVFVSEQDRVMNAAIKRARDSLDDFFTLHEAPPVGASNFKLKVMLSDDNGVEHFWFSPFKKIDGGFAGVLVNEPNIVKGVKYGEVYAFKAEQITDWGYEMNGQQYGSFTVCALFNFMEEDLVERYKRDHGFVCKD